MRILVTCALPYVNNVPHIGNIAGSHLPADIFARFCRLAGYETVFIGGSDEHGTPTEVAAEQLGVEPKELCDKYYEIHREIYAWMDISYDNFSRTSRREHHKTTKEFFKKIYSNGFISEGRLMLPYCEKCLRFLPDRYIEGTCPVCGYESARGDQCEKCSNMLNPDELEKARCTICGSSPRAIETKHLFLNLDKLEPRLEKWIKGKRAARLSKWHSGG
ncbi:MAG: class I tRNA ligase family protein [Candidatus Hydrothermarchaeaceae archaeon]